MNGTVMQAILFIFAGLFLSLLIIRRSKRKASRSFQQLAHCGWPGGSAAAPPV